MCIDPFKNIKHSYKCFFVLQLFQVKADRNNKKLHTLQQASRHVNDMAAVVVTSTKHGQRQISDQGEWSGWRVRLQISDMQISSISGTKRQQKQAMNTTLMFYRMNLLWICQQTLPKMHFILNHSTIFVVVLVEANVAPSRWPQGEIRSGLETSGSLFSPHQQIYFIFKLCLQPALNQVTSREAADETLCGFYQI